MQSLRLKLLIHILPCHRILSKKLDVIHGRHKFGIIHAHENSFQYLHLAVDGKKGDGVARGILFDGKFSFSVGQKMTFIRIYRTWDRCGV